MRIAFFVDQFPCLSETFILNQITGLIDRAHEVDIYCDRPTDTEKMHPEVEQYRLLERRYYLRIRRNTPRTIVWRYLKGIYLLLGNFNRAPRIILKSFNFLKYNRDRYGDLAGCFKPLFLMLPILRQAPYDIIQCHYGRNGLKAILLKDLGVIDSKIITTFHGHDLSSILERDGDRIYDYLFQRGDLLQPICDRWAKKLIALGCSPQKINIHPMGVDTNQFIPSLQPSPDSEPIVIISIARLVEMKGLSYGIEAIAQLLVNQPQLQLEYRIIGDGVLKTKLERQIKQLHLEKQVKLLGWQNCAEVQKIMAQADLVLAPSITSQAGDCEGIPVCLMETMAQGIPAIASESGGIPELVEDGVTGYLVPEKSVAIVCDRLERLVNNSRLRQQMGQAGRDKVLKNYNIDLLCDRLVDTYQQLIDQ